MKSGCTLSLSQALRDRDRERKRDSDTKREYSRSVLRPSLGIPRKAASKLGPHRPARYSLSPGHSHEERQSWVAHNTVTVVENFVSLQIFSKSSVPGEER